MNKKNNKKMLPLLLLALFMISIGAYGTRAYFTDNTSQKGDIKITMGHLDIENGETETWEYSGENLLLKGKDINFHEVQYVQPGDTFTKSFNFENTGNLYQTVTIKTDFIEEIENSPFELELNIIGNDENNMTVTLAPEEKVTAVLSIEVPKDLPGKHNESTSYNVENYEMFTLDLIEKNVIAEASQTNEE